MHNGGRLSNLSPRKQKNLSAHNKLLMNNIEDKMKEIKELDLKATEDK